MIEQHLKPWQFSPHYIFFFVAWDEGWRHQQKITLNLTVFGGGGGLGCECPDFSSNVKKHFAKTVWEPLECIRISFGKQVRIAEARNIS